MQMIVARTFRLLAGLLVCACVWPAAARADQLWGLLRARDLTPFGFLRLDMRPAYAVSIEPGAWAIETELGYQNTWALSTEVEKWLVSRETSDRRELGPADIDAIRALPGENYLVDTELASLDVTFHYKFSKNWTGYAIASAVRYGGGFLDSTIEGFHDTFGFSSFGRPAVARNDVNLIYDLKSSQAVFFDAPHDSGFTDPALGLRYTGISMSKGWQLAVEGAVKLPLQGKEELLSTGRTDYGMQVSLQRLGQHHGWYVSASAVYYAGSSAPVPQDETIVPTLVVGYERVLTEKTNINLQAYVSRSVYSREQTDLDELLEEKYQVSLGLRHRISRALISFGITENLQNVNNTPDIGVQLGIAYLP
jgi:hypothetical protein